MIKYRVYDKQAKQYIQSPNLLISADGWVFDMNDFGGARQFPVVTMRGWAWLPDSVIIEQYTGLKDKNGVEIASGDIVKRRTANYEKQVFEDEYGVVKYEKGSFYVDFRGDEDNLMLRYGEPEVIGNIHENAELLEEK